MVNKKGERIWGIILTVVSLVLLIQLKPAKESFLIVILLGAIVFGIFLIFSKDIKIRKKPTLKQKSRRALIGGIAGLIIGFWVLFITKSNLGFIPSILGCLLLMRGVLKNLW